jgi:asparagine synthase (glutamine-hydrolysing)
VEVKIMSVQCGRWNFDGKPADRAYLVKVRSAIAPCGPDGGDDYSGSDVSILYRALHTTKESRREIQPRVLPGGSVLTFDGRLDNREDLARKFAHTLEHDPTDLGIVAAAYEARGTESFSMLVGDWALAIWDPSDHSLVLAKDPIGVRPLYYSLAKNDVTWGSLLEPLVELAETKFSLDEEYLAGWLSFFPATHLTPYAGIFSVPPSSFVRIRPDTKTTTQYWDFEPHKIHCASDKDYEEQFRAVFRESVRRRLRSDSPVLAELSGGVDSSSIVCMADTILASGPTGAPALETVSYYDDSEPAWDERPYFTLVEQQRGQVGCHIDLASLETCEFATRSSHFQAAPGSGGRMAQIAKKLRAWMSSHGNRIILSGIGGDEFTGGVPTPVPEVADLLRRAQFGRLAHQLKAWALVKRSPWFHLLWEALSTFVPPALAGVPESRKPAAWLEQRFTRRHAAALSGYQQRSKFFGPLPSFQENLSTLDAMRRQISCAASSTELFCERRYPYLDRDFLEFIFATPRDQLVRPGERRSLMRRALKRIVPDALLDRKRKAFVARSPRVTITTQWQSLAAMNRDMISASLGTIDAHAFSEALEKARCGKHVAIVPLLRTLEVESWLRHVQGLGIVAERAQASPKRSIVNRAKHARQTSPEPFDLS